MESAIPPHLRLERTRIRRIPDSFRPPAASYVARFKPTVSRLVMAYFGIQHDGTHSPFVAQALDYISTRLNMDGGTTQWDRASYVDEAGFTNIVTVAYWDSIEKFEAWFPAMRAVWTAENHLLGKLGRFIEVLSPSVDGYETLFTTLERPERLATVADNMSGEI